MLITPHFFLWLLICPAVFSQCTSNQEQKRTRDIIQKLCSLGETRPVRCKSEAENMKVRSPKLPKQEESRLLVLEMSFRIVSDLLLKNASTEWKSSELQQLQESLGQQRRFYTACMKLSEQLEGGRVVGTSRFRHSMKESDRVSVGSAHPEPGAESRESRVKQSIHNLEVPVASSAPAEVEKWSAFWSSLADFLAEKSFSSCAWESARPVILQVMRSFYRSTTTSPRPIRSC